MATLLVVWGITFFFVWYSVVSNNDELEKMTNTLAFNVVTMAVYTAPVFFMVSGFLQTHAFIQRDNDGSMFSGSNLGKYYFRKVFRYMPLNIVAMLAVMYVLPIIGSGPIWDKFEVAINGCNTNWWTNVLWISNVYPRAYDDKCLPWTWFVPCYVQLSLLVPPILALFRYLKRGLAELVLVGLITLCILGNFVLTYTENIGATMVKNEDFYARIFMNPLYHASSFFYGIALCLIYNRFCLERGYESSLRNSISSRLMEFFRHNQAPRYVLYLCALSCMITSIFW